MNRQLLNEMISETEAEVNNSKVTIETLEAQLKIHKDYSTKTKKRLDELKKLLKTIEGE